ncbi:hypothetical protein DACRYDRAFT_22140 [Dacryopinax primogenitus]|uniref:Uncharacterized protein n=1 Tax=Dacryopinax primogenitus (strain DJM 731) TaxID=1858805 RepID=M5GCE2_DACPD|nr:uncharacterized protein DACRYDRAFT_22140 [Dacryopinax primogenitus]EJU01703.1 hypothetical protein DACRYDRAFT_22140 [Dacryopinax primogenitus]
MNDVQKGYFDTRAQFSIIPQAKMRLSKYSDIATLPPGLFPGTIDVHDPDDSIGSIDIHDTRTAYSKGGGGHEPGTRIPDFLGTRRQEARHVPFGIWDGKREEEEEEVLGRETVTGPTFPRDMYVSGLQFGRTK